MPIPALLAAQLGVAAVPSIAKGITGLFQLNKDVEKRDTMPEAAKEALALTRQAQASGTLPGQGQEENRINQGLNNTLQAGITAGSNSASVLGLLNGANQQRNQALASLGVRTDAYHQQQTQNMTEQLAKKAAYEKADQDAYEREKAGLTEGGLRNTYGALEGLSSIGVYALGKATGEKDNTNGKGINTRPSAAMLSPLLQDLPRSLWPTS